MDSSEKSGSFITPSTVIVFAATGIILKKLWDDTPRWIKKHISASGDKCKTETETETKTKTKKDTNKKDLTDPTAIFERLKMMFDLIDEKVSDVIPDHLPAYKLFASFISIVHLYEEIETTLPDKREKIYREVSEGEATEEDLRGLVQKMEFADWAYDEHRGDLSEKLKKESFDLLRFDRATEPGRVGHYIAINHDQKLVLIGLKGTSTISDILTDIIGHPVPYKLENSFSDTYPEKEVRGHEGIFTAALLMADDTQQLIENLFLPCKYRILITGHSLGAGTACLLGLLLRSRIPALQNQCKDYLEVFAFAPPPVLNYDAALACAPFTTSIVNNSDIIPRMSLSNLNTLNRLLLKANEKLKEKGRSPDNLSTACALVKDLLEVDDDFLMSVEELEDFLEGIFKSEDVRGVDNLYVPGRVIVLGTKQSKKEAGDDAPPNKEVADDAPPKKEADDEIFAVVGNGGMKMLRKVEPTTTCLTDHLAGSYIGHLKSVSNQCAE